MYTLYKSGRETKRDRLGGRERRREREDGKEKERERGWERECLCVRERE